MLPDFFSTLQLLMMLSSSSTSRMHLIQFDVTKCWWQWEIWFQRYSLLYTPCIHPLHSFSGVIRSSSLQKKFSKETLWDLYFSVSQPTMLLSPEVRIMHRLHWWFNCWRHIGRCSAWCCSYWAWGWRAGSCTEPKKIQKLLLPTIFLPGPPSLLICLMPLWQNHGVPHFWILLLWMWSLLLCPSDLFQVIRERLNTFALMTASYCSVMRLQFQNWCTCYWHPSFPVTKSPTLWQWTAEHVMFNKKHLSWWSCIGCKLHSL